ncbi:MAG: hypothetical protein WA395_05030 [Nitrososphaeraceae archaeon]
MPNKLDIKDKVIIAIPTTDNDLASKLELMQNLSNASHYQLIEIRHTSSIWSTIATANSRPPSPSISRPPRSTMPLL